MRAPDGTPPVGASRPPDPWTFEGARARQLRWGLSLTPAERLRWLEESLDELLPWLGKARDGKPVGSG